MPGTVGVGGHDGRRDGQYWHGWPAVRGSVRGSRSTPLMLADLPEKEPEAIQVIDTPAGAVIRAPCVGPLRASGNSTGHGAIGFIANDARSASRSGRKTFARTRDSTPFACETPTGRRHRRTARSRRIASSADDDGRRRDQVDDQRVALGQRVSSGPVLVDPSTTTDRRSGTAATGPRSAVPGTRFRPRGRRRRPEAVTRPSSAGLSNHPDRLHFVSNAVSQPSERPSSVTERAFPLP